MVIVNIRMPKGAETIGKDGSEWSFFRNLGTIVENPTT